MDEATKDKLYRYLLQALDDDNARDLETFGQNFLQSGAMWDIIADAFPTAKASEVRQIMMRAFQTHQQAHASGLGNEHLH
ncbi:MAG: hypothetical protein H7Y60_05400 [Rhodospirillaceae bacterium]|nr:hypothetical protein [Rhodospirillales bacterium]